MEESHDPFSRRGLLLAAGASAVGVTTLAATVAAQGSDASSLKAVVRRNTEEVQGRGDWALFDELFAEDFVDHTPQPGVAADKDGVRILYKSLRAAFPDFRAEIHWQAADGDLVITYKIYYGTHEGEFLGFAPTGRKIHFETVDAMRVRDGKITDHWGVGNLYSLVQQIKGEAGPRIGP